MLIHHYTIYRYYYEYYSSINCSHIQEYREKTDKRIHEDLILVGQVQEPLFSLLAIPTSECMTASETDCDT